MNAPEHGCTARELMSSWSVSGGTGPYAWTLVQAPPEFTLTSAGNTATVEGTPEAAGDHVLTLKVTDSEGRTNQRQVLIPVRATPILASRSLPAVCPYELYSVEFTADGSVAESLTWSADPAFVAQTGLTFDGNRLSGSFTGGASPGAFELEVSASNGDCAADPLELALTALGESHADCPTLAPSGFETFPRPCAGNPYEVEVIVDDGSGNYSLEAIALPNGLSFETTTQTFAGVVDAPGTATLRVSDENGHTIEQSFELDPRNACWLAYLSDETGVSQLQLFDPELERRHVLSESDSKGPVVDFAFSPDGRVLAFRSSVGADAHRVQLLAMPSLNVESLGFESASSYAWSDDSATLAVAYETPDGRLLGGAKVAAGAHGNVPTVTELTPIPAAVDEPLVWFAGEFVGFLTYLSTGWAQLVTASRVANGFEARIFEEDIHERQSRLYPSKEGLFLVPPSNLQLVYYNADGWASSAHAQIPRELRALAPSGRYLVRLRDELLELVRAEESSGEFDPIPEERVEGCDAILAWASGRERIACATADDGGRVAIFDVNTGTDSFEQRELVLGPYSLAAGEHTQRWRAFSRSGERFAFTTDNWLYVATLDDGTPRVKPPYPFSLADGTPQGENVYSQLLFSPDERHLLVHRGTSLEIFDVDADSIPNRNIQARVRASQRCEDDFTGRTGPYCGAEWSAAPYAWSHDSTWLVFQEELGTLRVMAARPNSEFQSKTVGEPCAETCPGGSAFAFQPSK